MARPIRRAGSVLASALIVAGCNNGSAAAGKICDYPPSAYDRSCVTNADCVAVAQYGECCPGAAISATASALYNADLANAVSECGKPACTASCPIQPGPCCRAGTCQLGAEACSLPVESYTIGRDAAAE